MFKTDPISIVVQTAWIDINEPDQNGKYVVTAAPADDEAAALIEGITDEAIEGGFNGKLPKGAWHPLKDPQVRRDDDTYRYPAHLRDLKFVFNAKTGFQPKCFATSRRIPCDPADIIGGDHCILEVSAYCYNNQQKGVGISLNSIWRIRKGEKAIVKGGAAGRTFDKVDVSKLSFDDED